MATAAFFLKAYFSNENLIKTTALKYFHFEQYKKVYKKCFVVLQ